MPRQRVPTVPIAARWLAVVEEPAPLSGKPLKLSECAPLFMSAYELRGAGAVIHSHSVHSVLATLLDPSSSEFRATNLEMIKGIVGHTYFGGCVVPIIENTARWGSRSSCGRVEVAWLLAR